MLKRASLVLSILILTGLAAAQDQDYGRFDVSVAAAAGLSKQSTGEFGDPPSDPGLGSVASPGVCVLAAGARWNSTTVAFGTRRNSTLRHFSTTSNQRARVFRRLRLQLFKTEKWEPFLLGGLGVLFFLPPHHLLERRPNAVHQRETERACLHLWRRSRLSRLEASLRSRPVPRPHLQSARLPVQQSLYRRTRAPGGAFRRIGFQVLGIQSGFAQLAAFGQQSHRVHQVLQGDDSHQPLIFHDRNDAQVARGQFAER